MLDHAFDLPFSQGAVEHVLMSAPESLLTTEISPEPF